MWTAVWDKSAGQDCANELLVVEAVLLLDLQLPEQLAQLILVQLLPQVCHHVPELLHSYR